MTLLTSTAHAELGRINETAVLMQERMRTNDVEVWWKQALHLVWQGEKTIFL